MPPDRPSPSGTGAWPARTALARSQSRVVPSRLVEARVLPSGANATASIVSRCPSRVWRSEPLARSHTFTVQSSEPEASVLPSAANATQVDRAGVPGQGHSLVGLGDVPDDRGGVPAPRSEALAVGRERQGGDRTLVPLQHGPLAARGQIPESDDPAVTAVGHGDAVGADGQGVDRSGGVAEPPNDLVGRDVPERHDGAPGRGRHRLASGANAIATTGSRCIMIRSCTGPGGRGPSQTARVVPDAHVPEPDRTIGAARGECLTIGRERHRPDRAQVALPMRPDDLSIRHVHERDRTGRRHRRLRVGQGHNQDPPPGAIAIASTSFPTGRACGVSCCGCGA